jgi:hypothetical protein
MFHALSRFEPSDIASLREAIDTHLRGVMCDPQGDRDLVFRVERVVAQDPSGSFAFDANGHAVLHADGHVFDAGRFETTTLRELRTRAESARERAGRPGARLRLHVVDGASPATDIGTLQAAAPSGALFQVASQFNCLEAPSPKVVPVRHYFGDGTQGPRASISAFPGTLLRHYAAPGADGARFVQTSDGPQVNLLDAVCSPDVAVVRNGYLSARTIARPDVLARLLEERWDDLRVGVHDGVQVVFGYDWLGPVPPVAPRIAHVLTSTLAAGLYGGIDSGDGGAMSTIIRQLQRAAYAGTLLAAAALGKEHVVLTLIGGGVFGNPVPVIWESILWAVDWVKPMLHRDTCVIVNGYALGKRVEERALEEGAASRGGTVFRF